MNFYGLTQQYPYKQSVAESKSVVAPYETCCTSHIWLDKTS